MKQKFYFHSILLLFVFLSFGGCKKHKTNNSVDQLPPETETGANTFGCLVNGKVFIPKGYSGTGKPNPDKIFDIGLNGLPYLQIYARQYDENGQNGNLNNLLAELFFK